MSGNTYYWQGGRKIEIKHAENLATVQAGSVEEVEAAAERAGVPIRQPHLVAPGVVKMEVSDNRDEGMQRLRSSYVVHHVYHTKDQPDDEILITDSFFIKFKQGTSRQAIDNYFQGANLEVVDVFDDLRFLVRVSDATGQNPIKASNLAASRPIVEYAEPNIIRQLTKFDFIPADPLFINQWHLHAPHDGTELRAGAGINASAAWDVTLGSRDVVVAVADDAIDLTHPDFQGVGKVVGKLNVRPDPNGIDLQFDEEVQPQPGDYHGTPCAGVAVAEHNGVGTVGVAPGCALYAVRFPLTLSEAQLARMFERISPHANIVSCSWGVGPADAPMSTTLREVIAQLAASGGRRGKGLVFCVAAGNNNCPIKDLNNTTIYQYRDRFGFLRSYSGPIDRWIAGHPDVLTVSASTSLKTRAAYSSWGAEINVCGPSNNFDDLRNFRPPGRGIWTTDNEGVGEGSDFTFGSRYTGDFGGTSSATPTVAGVCGLVLSRNPNLTGNQVMAVIEQSASKDLVIASDTPVNVPGDFNANGFSPWFGHGKVNAAAAVARAGETLVELQRIELAAQDVPITIPDTGVSVESHIAVDTVGNLADLRIQVQITHSYIGDLVIDLFTPDGEAVTLQNHQGGSQQNMDRTFSIEEAPTLQALLGKSVAGMWTLRVVDTWLSDQGRLEGWRLMAKLSHVAPTSPQPLAGKKKRGTKETVSAGKGY